MIPIQGPRGYRLWVKAAWLFVMTLLLALIVLWTAQKAFACDAGQYYDPTHQICQGSAPAYTRPGYGPWQNNYPGFPSNAPGGGWDGR